VSTRKQEKRRDTDVVPVIHQVARRLAVLGLHLPLDGERHEEAACARSDADHARERRRTDETRARDERDHVGANALRRRERPRLLDVRQEPA
jgi:hypothetical protein